MNKEVTLPSGATLRITMSSFAVAKALYLAVLEEAKSMTLPTQDTEIGMNFYKDLFCFGITSKRIEACLAECLKKALYNNLRITDEVFESEDARQDYLSVLLEVAKVNLEPFTKSLSVQLSHMLAMATGQSLKSKS